MINLIFLCQSEGCQISVPVRCLSNHPLFLFTCFPPPFLPGGGLSAPQEELDRLLQCRDQGAFLKSASTTPPPPGGRRGGWCPAQQRVGAPDGSFFPPLDHPLPPPDQTGDLKKRPMRGEGVSARSFPPVHSHVGHRRLRPPPSLQPHPPGGRGWGGQGGPWP